jgi:hypothetical protein
LHFLMPFTFSHPAATIPFLGRSKAGGWKSALVFGSMSPDLCFWIPFLSQRQVSHGRFGLVLDPPLALVLAWAFHRFVSPRLSRMPGLGGSDAPPPPFDWLRAWLGSLIGTATHIAWDQFTHMGSRFQSDPIFWEPIPTVRGMAFPLGQWIWLANSVAGLLALAAWALWRIHRRNRGWGWLLSPSWISVAIASVAPFAAIFAYLKLARFSGEGGMRRIFWMSGWVKVAMVASTLFCLASIWIAGHRRNPERSGEAANPGIGAP